MNVFEIFFSPTGTSRRVAESVARAMAGVTPAGTAADAGCLTTLDATHKPVATTVLAAGDAAVVAVPVYGGRVAPLALERLAGLDFGGAAVVGVVTYGNRDFERAAVELAGFVHTHGGRLVAVAAFVGEHSYSTEATPIAPGRPDMDDLAVANALGRAVRRKLALPAWKEADARKLKATAVDGSVWRVSYGSSRVTAVTPNVFPPCVPRRPTRRYAPTAGAAQRPVPPVPLSRATRRRPTRTAASAAVPV